MMKPVEQLISEYVDGDLPPAAARELEDHLRVCAACRVLLSEYYSLVAAVRLLAVRTDPSSDGGEGVEEIRRRRGFGQARVSDLLA